MINLQEEDLGSIMTLSNHADFQTFLKILERELAKRKKRNRLVDTGHREVDMNIGAEALIQDIKETFEKKNLKGLKGRHEANKRIREAEKVQTM